ncbi:MAG: DUF4399 domain-containing protein [Candidatus Thiodiazotropha endolucinida]
MPFSLFPSPSASGSTICCSISSRCAIMSSLQLVLGDKDHIPFDPPILSEKITITVK